MKELVEFLGKKKLLFKKLEPLDLKDYGFRQKYKLFYGIDTKSFYTIILFIEQKSRILQKNVDKYEEIVEALIIKKDHNFKKKIIIIDAPLCSKAKEKLKKLHWKVFHGSL